MARAQDGAVLSAARSESAGIGEHVWKPFQFSRSLFVQPKSGALEVGKEGLEKHLVEIYSDELRNAPPPRQGGWTSKSWKTNGDVQC